tara:strand:+ start:1408 stop:1854 length:447 start_codon:yes stop_codon:yes gene_type:complete
MIQCFKRGLIWRGLKHDLSKLNPKEFIPYAKFFYDQNNKPKRDSTGYLKPHDTGNIAFERAWNHHIRRNSHHWQCFCYPKDGDIGGINVLEMPKKDVIEMLCDWEGAKRAQKVTGPVTEWYEKNKYKLIFHSNTRQLIEEKLSEWYPN